MKRTALIMAGGKGERFWPRSRQRLPKQFLSLTDDGRTMIQLTVERILPIVELQDIYIATNAAYKPLVQAQLPGLPAENILCEPVGRNTAPCVGLGAVHMRKKYGDAVMLVLPSDHLIRHTDIFADVLKAACGKAEAGENLVTIGITPNYPETGYGYIRYTKTTEATTAEAGAAEPGTAEPPVYPVEQFVEKPDLERAKSYVAAGTYLWNSGMFAWKVSTLLANMQRFMPDTYRRLAVIERAVRTDAWESVLTEQFTAMESESVDYGIMEKAERIYILPGDFGWDDVGSWLAVGRIRQADAAGNTVTGNVLTVDCQNCVLEGGEKLIAVVGMQDTVIVDTEDALLVCRKEAAGKIKEVLQKLKEEQKEEYL